jgi:CRP/FNR family transcriptional regulator, cyclic AMP receptor protein
MAMRIARESDQKSAASRANANEKRAAEKKILADLAGVAKRIVDYRKSEIVYKQGDEATSVMFVQSGSVKLCVANKEGKEAILAMLGPGDFLGEGCLAGQRIRMNKAEAAPGAILVVIEKDEMVRALQSERSFSDRFLSHILSRNIRAEADLVDQLFNSTEKRLARTLLLLARYGKELGQQGTAPKVSQQMLAGMVGTTRTRVSFLMSKFKRLGFIEYKGGLKVNNSLLTVLLHDAGRNSRQLMHS